MAWRKPTNEEESSLELFLSTSCDAFGGIVFIMLLVMLLRSPTQGLEAGAAKTDTRIEQAALERARNALAQKERIYEVLQQAAGSFGDAEAQARLAQWARLSTEERELREAAELQRASAQQLEQTNTALELDLKFLQDARERLKEGLLLVEKQNAADGELRQTRLPRLRKVPKGNCFLAVFRGKVYPVWHVGAYGLSVDNRDDFFVEVDGEETKYTLRPEKGIPVNEWLNKPEGVQALRAVRPSSLVIANIILSAESLPDFYAVRNAFTGSGYDYNWSPLPANRSFVLYSSPGAKDAQ